MKVIALGCMQMSGKSKKTGNDYMMSRLFIANPATHDARENMTLIRHGFEGTEVEIPNELFKQLCTKPEDFPMVLELETRSATRQGRFVEEVVSARKSSSKPFEPAIAAAKAG